VLGTLMGALLGVPAVGAQIPRLPVQGPVRALVPGAADRAHQADTAGVPVSYRPPPGMCRIWLDNVPAAQQPASTDCSAAVRNRPANGRVLFGDDYLPNRERPKEGGKPSRERRPSGPSAEDAAPGTSEPVSVPAMAQDARSTAPGVLAFMEPARVARPARSPGCRVPASGSTRTTSRRTSTTPATAPATRTPCAAVSRGCAVWP
jgi:pyruvate/2-oxoglutarate dehydrogenase complex dihydrolipoamide acyltransferase (E2) component